MHYLYILYYENSNNEKLKIIEDKINKNLNEFFGNTFLKDKLLDIYKERKNIQLLNELNTFIPCYMMDRKVTLTVTQFCFFIILQ